MIELGKMFIQYSKIIPGGMVVFFPSYTFMETITKLWKDQTILTQIESQKKIFLESKQCSADEILKSYTKGVNNVNHHELFCNRFYIVFLGWCINILRCRR